MKFLLLLCVGLLTGFAQAAPPYDAGQVAGLRQILINGPALSVPALSQIITKPSLKKSSATNERNVKTSPSSSSPVSKKKNLLLALGASSAALSHARRRPRVTNSVPAPRLVQVSLAPGVEKASIGHMRFFEIMEKNVDPAWAGKSLLLKVPETGEVFRSVGVFHNQKFKEQVRKVVEKKYGFKRIPDEVEMTLEQLIMEIEETLGERAKI